MSAVIWGTSIYFNAMQITHSIRNNDGGGLGTFFGLPPKNRRRGGQQSSFCCLPSLFWNGVSRVRLNHTTLKGKTPNEVYFNRCAANAKPPIEIRPLVKQRTDIAVKANSKVKISINFFEGRLHLPILKVECV